MAFRLGRAARGLGQVAPEVEQRRQRTPFTQWFEDLVAVPEAELCFFGPILTAQGCARMRQPQRFKVLVADFARNLQAGLAMPLDDRSSLREMVGTRRL